MAERKRKHQVAQQPGLFGVNHDFGGDWTEEKLNILDDYLRAYLTALKNQRDRFKVAYIDAFAGTGYRTLSDAGAQESIQIPLQGASEAADESFRRFLEGSARRALRVQPGFDTYIYAEKSPARAAELEGLKTEFPDRNIRILKGDANVEMQRLCDKKWVADRDPKTEFQDGKERRGVLFLDPYGMAVTWETLKAIAATQAIDLWFLFPSGIGVNRMLTSDGQIPEGWKARLDACFGTSDWYGAFYQEVEDVTLFGTNRHRLKVADFDRIEAFMVKRLQTIFPAVAEHPRRLCNSKGSPMYSLCFAAANLKGAEIALRIADHLLKKL